MASGVSLAEINDCFGDNKEIPTIRIMPNVNVEINEGMTAFVRNKFVSDIIYEQIKSLFDDLGRTLEMPEKTLVYLLLWLGVHLHMYIILLMQWHVLGLNMV